MALLCTVMTTSLLAQDSEKKAKKVLIENADRSISEIIEKVNVQFLKGNVRIIHDSIFMFCDSASIRKNKLNAIGDVIIIQEDTINVFADSLYYDGDLKRAELYFDVVLKSNGKELFTEALIYEMDEKIAYFQDTATMRKGTMRLSSLRGIYDVNKKEAKFYDEVSVIDDDIKLKTDSLLYDIDIDRAYFIAPTYIEQGKNKIYCEKGYYDMVEKRGYFSDNPIVSSDNKIVKAKNILYNGNDSTIVLSGKASIKDSISYASGDEITINESTNLVTLDGNAFYKKEGRTVRGPLIIYNEKTENLKLNGRSIVNNENGILQGDTIVYDSEIDFGEVYGNAIWTDTTAQREIVADKFFYKEKKSFFKAVKGESRPLFKQLIEGDTLYLSADTLQSEKLNDSLSYLKAVRSVKIFKSDLQAICDSLYYSDHDSTFTLFHDPVIWSDTTQFSADTLSIVLRNDEVSEIIALTDAFIISSDSEAYYNQIKGRYIHSYLDSNTLEKMMVKGNSESLYLIKDESDALLGPNHTVCSHMLFIFENKELMDISFYTEPASTLVPIEKALDSDLTLEGFNWRIKERPAGLDDLLKLLVQKSIPIKDEFSKTVDEIMTKKDALPKSKSKRLK